MMSPGAAAKPGKGMASGPQAPRPFLAWGVPNPAYGELYGLRWDGKQWVPKNPNEDLERQMMELELERRRQEMEEEDGGEQSALLKSWLAKRLGRA